MLAQMLFDVAAHRPDATAVASGGARLTYGELAEVVARLAAGLGALGVAPGDRVALVQGNSPEYVASFFAVAALGAVAVPLNPQLAREELSHYCAHTAARVAVVDPPSVATWREIVAAAGRPIALVATAESAEADTTLDALVRLHDARTPSAVSPVADVVYQYSSGSTGRPKRVPRTHAQCAAEAESFVGTTALGPDDRIFCAVPLFHTHGQGNCMLAAVRSGAALVILDNPNPFLLQRHRALALMVRERVTVFPGVPFLFRMLADTGADADLSSLRLCFSAGTALPQDTFDDFRRRFGVAVRQLYGCTEAGALTLNRDADPVPTAASVGTPLRGVSVRILDEAQRPAATGTVGEIAIRTPAMTVGYHDMAEHNREVFRDGWFVTGDLGRLDDAGRLWITGRKRLFIEVAGNKVDPVEIEDVLATHPAVREVVVVGVPGKGPGEEIVKAVVVAADTVLGRELQAYCQDRLARFKVPQVVEFRAEIPKSPLGKVLRKYLV